MKQSQTPWQVTSGVGISVMQKRGRERIDHERLICRMNSYNWSLNEQMDNAQHIVKCVNSHDELMKSLKRCITDDNAVCYRSDDGLLRRLKAINRIAEEAISKAEGSEA